MSLQPAHARSTKAGIFTLDLQDPENLCGKIIYIPNTHKTWLILEYQENKYAAFCISEAKKLATFRSVEICAGGKINTSIIQVKISPEGTLEPSFITAAPKTKEKGTIFIEGNSILDLPITVTCLKNGSIYVLDPKHTEAFFQMPASARSAYAKQLCAPAQVTEKMLYRWSHPPPRPN